MRAAIPAVDRRGDTIASLLAHDAWSSLLRGDRSAVLERFASGDPLGLFARCALELRERYVLLDVERLYVYVLGRLAIEQEPEAGSALDPWLVRRIDDGIRDILRQDEHEETVARTPCAPGDERYTLLTKAFGVPPQRARAVSVRFNGLAEAPRRAFFALIVEGRSVEHCLARGWGPREKLIEDVRCAWQAFRNPPRDERGAESASESDSGG